MSLQIQGVPFLAVNGGLNTTSSPINIPPQDAADMSNMELLISGSLRPRKSIDFISPKVTSPYVLDRRGNFVVDNDGDKVVGLPDANPFFHTVDTKMVNDEDQYIDLAPSSTVIEVKLANDTYRKFLVACLATDLYIYNFDDLINLADVENPYQIINLGLVSGVEGEYSTSVITAGTIYVSTESGANTGDKAIDNDEDTYWQSTDDKPFWAYDFGADNEKAVSKYTIKAASGVNDNCFRDFKFQGSNDSTDGTDGSWTTLDTQSGLTYTNKERKVFYIDNEVEYQWYRFLGTVSRTIYISEFELMETVQENYVLNDAAKFYRTRYDIDQDKLFIINRHMNVGYIQLNDDDLFEFNKVSIYKRDIDEDNDPDSDSMVNNNSKAYICVKAHTSSSETEPGEGVEWKEYWDLWGGEIEDDSVTDWADATAYTSNVVSAGDSFSTGCFSAGRFWLAGNPEEPSTVYYSQVITKDTQYGRMFPKGDPLSVYDSSIVDDDGSTFQLSGCERILAITAYKSGIVVFGSNGVWYIGGASSTESFSSTSYSIDKLSNYGIIGEDAYCLIEDIMAYFSTGGAHAIVKENLLGTLSVKSLSDKIESLYTSIPISNRAAGKAVYNPSDRKMFFLCNIDSRPWQTARNPYRQATHFRDILVYDVRLESWSKYSIGEDTAGDLVSIGDMIAESSTVALNNYITDNDYMQVYDNNLEYVTSLSVEEDAVEYVNVCIFLKKWGDFAAIAFGRTDASTPMDFNGMVELPVITAAGEIVVDNDGEAVTTGSDAAAIEAYWKSAVLTFKDLMHKKQSPYVYFVFNRVESNVVNSDNTDLTEGSCLFTPIFDFASNATSHKYGTARQIYRPNKWNMSRYNGTDPGYDVVTVKEKVRGRGNAIQFRLDKDGNKPFELHGFHMDISMSPRV